MRIKPSHSYRNAEPLTHVLNVFPSSFTLFPYLSILGGIFSLSIHLPPKLLFISPIFGHTLFLFQKHKLGFVHNSNLPLTKPSYYSQHYMFYVSANHHISYMSFVPWMLYNQILETFSPRALTTKYSSTP